MKESDPITNPIKFLNKEDVYSFISRLESNQDAMVYFKIEQKDIDNFKKKIKDIKDETFAKKNTLS